MRNMHCTLKDRKFNLHPSKKPTPSHGNSLPLPKQALVFMCLQYKSFKNTAGKGEIARNFYTVFYSFGELSAIFIKFEIVICELFRFGGV